MMILRALFVLLPKLVARRLRQLPMRIERAYWRARREDMITSFYGDWQPPPTELLPMRIERAYWRARREDMITSFYGDWQPPPTELERIAQGVERLTRAMASSEGE